MGFIKINLIDRTVFLNSEHITMLDCDKETDTAIIITSDGTIYKTNEDYEEFAEGFLGSDVDVRLF